MKLTLAITTYNRTDMVLEAFEKVYDHPLIDEIVIVDDASTEENWIGLNRAILYADMSVREGSRIKLFRNPVNLGMSRNKAEAISKAKNEWCILFDSDNILYPEYLDSLAACNFEDDGIIYHPQKAEPEHDYSSFSWIDKTNAKDYLGDRDFRCLLNNSNYVVNRDEYLRIYKYNPDIQEADTIWMNTNWLKAGNAFYVVPGMWYAHRKHPESGWLKGNQAKNIRDANNLQEEIRLLK